MAEDVTRAELEKQISDLSASVQRLTDNLIAGRNRVARKSRNNKRHARLQSRYAQYKEYPDPDDE